MTSGGPAALDRLKANTQDISQGNEILRELLTELALVLLPRGLAPRAFEEIARHAFVNAAATMSQLRNGRVNQSKVAALTGLSRVDVKRLLQQSNSSDSYFRTLQTPILRVIDAWRSDRKFVDRYGTPKKLPISGPTGSFEQLVKRYGGDVSHRAILDELVRTRAVSRVGKRIALRDSSPRRPRKDFKPLRMVLPALIDGIQIASQKSPATLPSIHRLSLAAENELDLAMMKQRCSSTVKSMLEGLGESLGVKAARGKSRPKRSFTITVLLVEHR